MSRSGPEVIPIVPDPRHLPRGVPACVLAPAYGGRPLEHADLLGLLPVDSANRRLEAALAGSRRPLAREGLSLHAAIFAADPFQDWLSLADALEAAGVRGVVNLPSVALHEGDFGHLLDQLGLGLEAEAERLGWFRARGFEASGLVRGIEGARAMLRRDVARLILHPGVPLLEAAADAQAGSDALAALEAIRKETAGVPVLLYDPPGFGRALDAARAAAEGLVRLQARYSSSR